MNKVHNHYLEDPWVKKSSSKAKTTKPSNIKQSAQKNTRGCYLLAYQDTYAL